MARGSIYTKRLGRAVAKKAKETDGKYHVIPFQVHCWGVVAEGNLRPVRTFNTKAAAVAFAKKHARSEVIVHGADGSTIGRISY